MGSSPLQNKIWGLTGGGARKSRQQKARSGRHLGAVPSNPPICARQGCLQRPEASKFPGINFWFQFLTPTQKWGCPMLAAKARPPGADVAVLDRFPGLECGRIGRVSPLGLPSPHPGDPPPLGTKNCSPARFPGSRRKKNGPAGSGAQRLGATHLQMTDPQTYDSQVTPPGTGVSHLGRGLPKGPGEVDRTSFPVRALCLQTFATKKTPDDRSDSDTKRTPYSDSELSVSGRTFQPQSGDADGRGTCAGSCAGQASSLRLKLPARGWPPICTHRLHS